MTPGQAFNIIDRLTKAIAIIDTKGRQNEGCTSQMLFNEDAREVRQLLITSLNVAKSIEISD